MFIRSRKANLTFEDECSKGGEDVISRIFVHYDKLETKPFRDAKSRLLAFDFVLRPKLFMNLMAWNI